MHSLVLLSNTTSAIPVSRLQTSAVIACHRLRCSAAASNSNGTGEHVPGINHAPLLLYMFCLKVTDLQCIALTPML